MILTVLKKSLSYLITLNFYPDSFIFEHQTSQQSIFSPWLPLLSQFLIPTSIETSVVKVTNEWLAFLAASKIFWSFFLSSVLLTFTPTIWHCWHWYYFLSSRLLNYPGSSVAYNIHCLLHHMSSLMPIPTNTPPETLILFPIFKSLL